MAEVLEKFKNSLKKNLEKSVTDLKKNIENVVSSHEKSKTNLKSSLENSIELLRTSNTELHEQELTNLEDFNQKLNENLANFVSTRSGELNKLRDSFLMSLNSINSKFKDDAVVKIELVKGTYENFIKSINGTFSQQIKDFLGRIESSKEELSKVLGDLEEKTFNNIAKHYQNVNESFNQNKETVNNLVIMIFNEIKSTTESSFLVIKEHLNFLQKNTANQLSENNQVFIEYFKKLREKYGNDVKKFSLNMSDYFNQVKQRKETTSNILIEQIKTNLQVNEMQAFSKIIEALKIFTDESNRQFNNFNQLIQDNLSNSINVFVKELADFNQESQEYFSKFISAQAQNIKELKVTVEERLNKMIKEQDVLSNEFKEDYLSVLMVQLKEYTAQTEQFFKDAATVHEENEQELLSMAEKNENTLISFEKKIYESEANLNSLYEKGAFTVTTVDAFKKQLGSVLKELENLKVHNSNFRIQLQKNHEKSAKHSLKNKDSLINILMGNNKIMETGLLNIQKSLDKKIEAFLKKFYSNVDDLKSKVDLFGNLDLQIQTFQSSIDHISDELLTIKNKYNQNLLAILNDLTAKNNDLVTEYNKLLQDEISIFYKNYETHMINNVEEIKNIAKEVISGQSEITPLQLPEVDAIFKNLVKIFETATTQSRDVNEKLIKKDLEDFNISNDELENDFNRSIAQFETEVNVLFDINQSEHENLLKFFKESYETQFHEFEDRMNQDMVNLKGANQENISKILLKSAEAGNKFFEDAEKNSKESKIIINDFLKKFVEIITNFNTNFNSTIEDVKLDVIDQITQDNDILFREHYELPPKIQEEYENNLDKFEETIDGFMKEHETELNQFKNKTIEILKSNVDKHLDSILQNVNEAKPIDDFLNSSFQELDTLIKGYSNSLEGNISNLKKILKKLAEKDANLENIIDSI